MMPLPAPAEWRLLLLLLLLLVPAAVDRCWSRATCSTAQHTQRVVNKLVT
jgi:hypothetical protein